MSAVEPTDVRGAYDAVAETYDERFTGELERKPLDRAVLAAFVELAVPGPIADVGCGPGHLAPLLAGGGARVTGVDLSETMVAVARRQRPEHSFLVGSMLDLPLEDASFGGVAALYSIIHLPPEDRNRAFEEFARVLRPGGWLLVAFHVEAPGIPVGSVNHLTEFLGQPVHLDGYFLAPDEIAERAASAGLRVVARIDREPIPDAEFPSQRCTLLLQRSCGAQDQ